MAGRIAVDDLLSGPQIFVGGQGKGAIVNLILVFATPSETQQNAFRSARQDGVATARRTKPVVRQPVPYGRDLCAPSRLIYPPRG